MKYIRTKETIFEVVDENEKVFYVKAKGNPHNTYGKSKCQTNIINQADTIEELCDVLVSIRDNWHDIWNDFEDCKVLCSESEIYGAIWTDKGLIYVAKMNDKGELELL